MSHESPDSASLSSMDVAMDQGDFADCDGEQSAPNSDHLMIRLLHQLVVGQERQNELLEEMSKQFNATQRQRTSELAQWKQAHPQLSRKCRKAAEALGRVQTEFLRSLTEEVTENADGLLDSDFVLNEFVDRFGPRLAHLNSVLQMLSQLSAVPGSTNNSKA